MHYFIGLGNCHYRKPPINISEEAINDEFDLTIPISFTIDDYNELDNKSSFNTDEYCLHEIDFVETVFFNNVSEDIVLHGNSFDIIKNHFKKNNIRFSVDKNNHIFLSGMVIYKHSGDIVFKIDQLNLIHNVTILSDLFRKTYSDKLLNYWLYFVFYTNVELLTTNFKLTSRLSILGINLIDPNGMLFEYKSIQFAIDDWTNDTSQYRNRKHLRIVYSPKNFQYDDIFDLISILFENNIIWKSSEGGNY